LTRTRAKTRKGGARHQPGPFRVGRSRTGLGLFAVEPIRKGKFIIEYRGRRLLWKDVEDINNKYLFDLNTRWALDGSPRSNTARYINHSCKPNAVPYGVGGKIKIYAKRTIQPGEEITYDYGKEYFDEILAPIGCKCAACAPAPKGRKKSPKGRSRGARA
jgi:SET domain-containing protein